MVATYLGAPSPLATVLGVGRPVRSARRSQGSLLLDPWGFALTAAFEPARQSAGSWRVHHDALTHLFHGDAMRAGVEGRMEPHGLFADLLPAPVGHQRRTRRDRGPCACDAILDRPRVGADVERCPHLSMRDLEIIHMCQTSYTQERVLQAALAQCADMCAPMRPHAGDLRHARGLDARHHAGVRDPDERPILPPLTLSVCCSTLRCVGTVSALSASARVTCTRCSMTPSARLPSGTGARRGRPPRAATSVR